jgi:hypothetical protein
MSRATLRQVAALAAELGLAALAAALLLALAWAHNVNFDLTPTREHTLSDPAQRVAARLSEDVDVTVFYNSQDQGRVRQIRELLRRFGDQSPHFRYKMYDLDRSPLLAARLGAVNYDTAILEGYGRRLKGVRVEEADLTTQLIRLVEGRERVVLFAVGHGEHDPGDADPRSGLSLAAKALETENFRVERSQDLRGGIPGGTSLLVVANPTGDFTEGEVAAVVAYLRAGGGSLFLLEAGVPPRVAALLARFGLVCGNDLVVDERNRLFFADAFAPQVALFNEEVMPYTGAPPALLPLAQSVEVVAPQEPDVRLAPFAFTGSDTWSDVERVSGEGHPPVFREGIDRRGPVPVAAVARLSRATATPGAGAALQVGAVPAGPSPAATPAGSTPAGREDGSILVVGDAEFATNLYFGSLGNRDFFVNLAHLAARTEALIATRGASAPGGTFSQLYLTAAQARILFWTGVVLFPAIVLAIGAYLGWRRRLRSGR